MKKFLVLTLLLFFAQGAFALDLDTVKQKAANVAVSQGLNVKQTNNLKQIKAENETLKNFNTPQMRLKFHYGILSQDKVCFDEGGESLYGTLIQTIKNNKNSLNTHYAKLAKALFDDILKVGFEDAPTPAEFEKKKIIIPDSDFDFIEEDVREVIYALNVY